MTAFAWANNGTIEGKVKRHQPENHTDGVLRLNRTKQSEMHERWKRRKGILNA